MCVRAYTIMMPSGSNAQQTTTTITTVTTTTITTIITTRTRGSGYCCIEHVVVKLYRTRRFSQYSLHTVCYNNFIQISDRSFRFCAPHNLCSVTVVRTFSNCTDAHARTYVKHTAHSEQYRRERGRWREARGEGDARPHHVGF